MDGVDIGFFDNRPDHAVNNGELPGQRTVGVKARELVQAHTRVQTVQLLLGMAAGVALDRSIYIYIMMYHDEVAKVG